MLATSVRVDYVERAKNELLDDCFNWASIRNAKASSLTGQLGAPQAQGDAGAETCRPATTYSSPVTAKALRYTNDSSLHSDS